MKTRKIIIMILTLCVALSFTACTGKGDSGKADSASVSEGTDKTEDLQAKLDDLYQQENQIFSIFFLKALDQPLQLRAGEVVHPVTELARQVAGALLGQNGGEFVPTQ